MSVFSTSTTSLYDTTIQALMEAEYKFRTTDDASIIQMGFSLENGTYQLYMKIREDRRQVLLFGYLDSKVPPDKRGQVAEVLVRANYGLLIGNFELDMDNGDLRYKTSVDVDGGQLTPKMVQNLIAVNVGTLNRYVPAVLSVIYGNVDPKDAFQKVDG